MNRLTPMLFASILLASGAISGSPAEARERCYDVEVQRGKPVKDHDRVAGTAIGAVAGGLLGNQIGGGSGKKAATVAGVVGGAYAGNQIQKKNQRRNSETVIERRCVRD